MTDSLRFDRSSAAAAVALVKAFERRGLSACDKQTRPHSAGFRVFPVVLSGPATFSPRGCAYSELSFVPDSTGNFPIAPGGVSGDGSAETKTAICLGGIWPVFPSVTFDATRTFPGTLPQWPIGLAFTIAGNDGMGRIFFIGVGGAGVFSGGNDSPLLTPMIQPDVGSSAGICWPPYTDTGASTPWGSLIIGYALLSGFQVIAPPSVQYYAYDDQDTPPLDGGGGGYSKVFEHGVMVGPNTYSS